MYRNYKTFSIYVSRRVHKTVFEQSTLFAILNNPRYSAGPCLTCIIFLGWLFTLQQLFTNYTYDINIL